MRIVDRTDPICKWYHKISGEDLRVWKLELSLSEIAILRRAYEVCSKAADLQTEINERMGIGDECYNNDYSWVTIHLSSIL